MGKLACKESRALVPVVVGGNKRLFRHKTSCADTQTEPPEAQISPCRPATLSVAAQIQPVVGSLCSLDQLGSSWISFAARDSPQPFQCSWAPTAGTQLARAKIRGKSLLFWVVASPKSQPGRRTVGRARWRASGQIDR